MQAIGINRTTHENLYDQVYNQIIEGVYSEEEFIKAFTTLERASITYEKHKSLCEAVIQNVRNAALIEDVGITDDQHKALYKLFIATARAKYRVMDEELAPAFKVLIDVDITIAKYEISCESYIKRMYGGCELNKAFIRLLKAGFSYHQYPFLYQALIQKSYNAVQLVEAFAVMYEAGVTYAENIDLYKTIIDSTTPGSSYSYDLATVFVFLIESGISYEQHNDLYKAVNKNACNAKQLLEVFSALKDADMSYGQHKSIWESVIQKAYYAGGLADAFHVLKSAGMTYGQYEALWKDVVDKASDARELADAFYVLDAARMTYSQHEALWKVVVQKANYSYWLAAAFAMLNNAGISHHEHKDLYDTVIKNAQDAKRIFEVFEILRDERIAYDEHTTVYQAFIQNPPDATELSQVLKTMMDSREVDFQHQDSYQLVLNVLAKDFDLSYLIFNKLTGAGFAYAENSYIYHLFFGYIKHSEYQTDQIISMLNQLCSYVKAHPEKTFEKNETEQMMREVEAGLYCVTAGPLEKTKSTRDIERLLADISILSESDFRKIKMTFDALSGYIITLPDKSEIHLTLLLRSANLSHLTLSDALIEKIGKKMKVLSRKTISKKEEDPILKQLPSASRDAMQAYFTERYHNINRLFRGEELSEKYKYGWIRPYNKTPNLLNNFLCGCLISDAINKLPTLKKDLPSGCTSKPVLYRLEQVSDELRKRRLTRVLTAPAPQSFSTNKGGSTSVYSPSKEVTILRGDFLHFSLVNQSEGEVVISHGEQLRYVRNPMGGFFASLVRSPDYVRPDRYWSDRALSYAYCHYLHLGYRDATSNDVVVNKKTIERPNHGLAHTFRVMENITPVLDYFARHAKDKLFKTFCQNISFEECEWLRVAAAFRVTGRESEISHSENPDLYNKYKEASKNNLKKFLEECSPEKSSNEKEMKERVLHVVQYMGHPEYEQAPDNKKPINTYPNEAERLHRNYLHRILTIAHNLDLPRCYSPKEFEAAMEPCRDLSNQDTIAYKADYDALIRHSIALIKAHGNVCLTDIALDGTLKDSDEEYQTPFEQVSTSLKAVAECSETVPVYHVSCKSLDPM